MNSIEDKLKELADLCDEHGFTLVAAVDLGANLVCAARGTSVEAARIYEELGMWLPRQFREAQNA